MTHFLLATDSVHTTAALCDYLSPRLGPDDEVTVLAVTGTDLDERDAADALNVAGVRLGDAGAVETVTRDGDPTTVILEYTQTVGPDEVLIGVRGGDPAESTPGVGSTTTTCLAEIDRPTVVVPTTPVD